MPVDIQTSADTFRVAGQYRQFPTQRRFFWVSKRCFDVCVSITVGIPVAFLVLLLLIVLNPFFNPGPLLFRQVRMGKNQHRFVVIKFRTMRPVGEIGRGPDDPLERERITPLGRWLRRLHLDELPQIVNVLRGEMSLIGPRPDFIPHANDYATSVPGYRLRHVTLPGLTGYAQVQLGYAEGYELAAAKTHLDLFYIRNASWRLEVWIVIRTFAVILSGFGAK